MSWRSAPKPASTSEASTAALARRDAGLLVTEQVNVVSQPADHPVGDQGVSAAEGKAVGFRGSQGDRGHLAMQVVKRHQPTGPAWSGRGGGRGLAQARVPLLPGPANSAGEVQVGPQRDQRVRVEELGQLFRG